MAFFLVWNEVSYSYRREISVFIAIIILRLGHSLTSLAYDKNIIIFFLLLLTFIIIAFLVELGVTWGKEIPTSMSISSASSSLRPSITHSALSYVYVFEWNGFCTCCREWTLCQTCVEPFHLCLSKSDISSHFVNSLP